MCEIGGRRSCSLWLTLCHVNLDPDSPRDAEYCGENVDRNDDNPTACSRIAMNSITRVESAYQKHCDAEPEAPVDGTVSTAPFVGEEESGYSYAEDNECGHSRGEKRSFRRSETGLCEEKRCVLTSVSGFLCEQCIKRGF